MQLRAFSLAVGTSPRWVQNAFAALGLDARYTVARARQLACARALRETCGMPLGEAYRAARRALAGWPRVRRWELASPDGAVTLAIDLERFLSTFSVRLSLSRTLDPGRRPGRPPGGTRSGISRARDSGVDISLLEASLRRTAEERLRRLDADIAFVRSLRVGRGAGRRLDGDGPSRA